MSATQNYILPALLYVIYFGISYTIDTHLDGSFIDVLVMFDFVKGSWTEFGQRGDKKYIETGNA